MPPKFIIPPKRPRRCLVTPNGKDIDESLMLDFDPHDNSTTTSSPSAPQLQKQLEQLQSQHAAQLQQLTLDRDLEESRLRYVIATLREQVQESEEQLVVQQRSGSTQQQQYNSTHNPQQQLQADKRLLYTKVRAGLRVCALRCKLVAVTNTKQSSSNDQNHQQQLLYARVRSGLRAWALAQQLEASRREAAALRARLEQQTDRHSHQHAQHNLALDVAHQEVEELSNSLRWSKAKAGLTAWALRRQTKRTRCDLQQARACLSQSLAVSKEQFRVSMANTSTLSEALIEANDRVSLLQQQLETAQEREATAREQVLQETLPRIEQLSKGLKRARNKQRVTEDLLNATTNHRVQLSKRLLYVKVRSGLQRWALTRRIDALRKQLRRAGLESTEHCSMVQHDNTDTINTAQLTETSERDSARQLDQLQDSNDHLAKDLAFWKGQSNARVESLRQQLDTSQKQLQQRNVYVKARAGLTQQVLRSKLQAQGSHILQLTRQLDDARRKIHQSQAQVIARSCRKTFEEVSRMPSSSKSSPPREPTTVQETTPARKRRRLLVKESPPPPPPGPIGGALPSSREAASTTRGPPGPAGRTCR